MSLASISFILSHLAQDKSFGNKVARVLELVNEETQQDDLENVDDDKDPVPGVEVEEEKEEENEGDDWVEDLDNQMMDAKVMKKGKQKMIIVDLPNPKGKWVKQNHEAND